MSRRHRAQKREVLPDPKFGDLIVSKFMNTVMRHGKKSAAEALESRKSDLQSQLNQANADAAAAAAGCTIQWRANHSAARGCPAHCG